IMAVQKKGRNIAVTVNELLESVRMRIAVDAFKLGDSSYLRAILTELCLEIFGATKAVITREVGKACASGWVSPETGERRGQGLTQGDVVSYLRSLDVDILTNLNIWWSLSDAEKALYLGDIRSSFSPKKEKETVEGEEKKYIKKEKG